MSIVDSVLDALGETTISVFWPKEHVYDAINAALVLAWVDVNEDQHVGYLNAQLNTPYASLPPQLMIPKKLVGMQGDMAITKVQELERHNSKWRDIGVAEPMWVIPWGAEKVRLYPVADANYVLDVYGIAYPPEVSVMNEDISCAETLKHGIMCLAVSILVEDTHPDLGEFYISEYKQHIREYQRSRRSSGNKFNVLRPANSNSFRQSGIVSGYREL